MSVADIVRRVQGRYQRTVADRFHRRVVRMNNAAPIVSFTFDDFPRSALQVGGDILHRHGLSGTYYASLGMMGTEAPTGEIFVAEDLPRLFAQGHELGCHTFSHCHSWDTPTDVFEQSVIENRQALEHLQPGWRFRSFSYPISGPRVQTKGNIGRHFRSCRGGGQVCNAQSADLNLLKSFFLEKSRDDGGRIRAMLDENRRQRGWLVFSTHDISETPTVYGVTPALFEAVVRWSLESGANVLTVGDAVESILRHSDK